MSLFPIRTEADHARAVALIDEMWSRELDPSGERLREQLCALVDAWESAFVPLGGRDPLAAIESRRRALGWSQRELARRLGWSSSGRVSEVLSGRRPLTLGMMRDLSSVLEIPLPVLVHDGDGERERERGEWVWLPAEVASEVNQAAIVRGQAVSNFIESALLDAADACWAHSQQGSRAAGSTPHAFTLYPSSSGIGWSHCTSGEPPEPGVVHTLRARHGAASLGDHERAAA